GSDRNAATEDDVFFKAVKLVDLTTCSRTDKYARGVLEAGGAEERIGRKAGLGNTKQKLVVLSGLFAFFFKPLILFTHGNLADDVTDNEAAIARVFDLDS